MKPVISFASAALFAASLFQTISAQTYMTGLGKYGSHNYVPNTILPYYAVKNYPVMDFNSNDLRCRTTETDVTQTDTQVFQIDKTGTNVTLYWEPESKTIVTKEPLPAFINGPCMVYMAPYEYDATDGWFKIFELGKYGSKWCTDKIREARGKLDVMIPKDIAPGKYYLRGETIGLNYSELTMWDDYTQGAQSFANCAVIEIVEGGDVVPDGEKIPGIYHRKDKSLKGDFEDADDSYKAPGPAVYKAGSSSSTSK
ncbi:hypothetical protein LPJ57_002678 [Coemansia sp. RSA 486]|nr:hypothetical protein LPJ57_002678 [Coemansia sp. RSA 486]